MSTLTKQALADALKTKMQTKRLDKITIKELVDSCDVNRQTFYYHFQDIYDLLRWIYMHEAINSVGDRKGNDTWQRDLAVLAAYIKDNREFCINTYRSIGREHLVSFLNNATERLLHQVIGEMEGVERIAEQHKGFIVRFYTHAFVGVLLDWLEEGLGMSSQEIIANMETLMVGHFEEAVDRFGSK